MYTLKLKTDKNLLLAQCEQAMARTRPCGFYYKVAAVKAVIEGASTMAEAARPLNVSKMAVSYWVRAVDEHGVDSLRAKPYPGRPRKLAAAQRQDIDEALSSDPRSHGFKVWDGPTLAAYVLGKHGVKVSIRLCQRLMHELGYSLIRPQTHPSKGDEDDERRQAFKKKWRR